MSLHNRGRGQKNPKEKKPNLVWKLNLKVMFLTVLPPMLPMVRPRPLDVRRSNNMLLLPSFTQNESSATGEELGV